MATFTDREPAIRVQVGGTAILDFKRAEAEAMFEAVRRQLLKTVARPEGYAAQMAFFDAAEMVSPVLPARAVTTLSRLKRGILDAGVFRGFVSDKMPQHDENPGRAFPMLGQSWLAIVARHLGYEYSYEAEKRGDLIHDVIPTQDRVNTQSNASSAVELALHTEIAFHDVRPDFVVLYCVRSGKSLATTHLARVDDIVSKLSEEHLAVLRQPRFQIRAPDSFVFDGAAVDERHTIAPLGGSERYRTIRWHGSIIGTDAEACSVVDMFLRQATVAVTKVPLEPGDLIVFSNDRCLHGRDAFAARFNGSDRWLLRTYVLRDITRIASIAIAGPGPVVAMRHMARLA